MKKNIIYTSLAVLSITASQAASIAWSSSAYLHSPSPLKNNMGTGQFATTGTQWVAENSGGAATLFDGINFDAGTQSLGNVFSGFHLNVTTNPISSTGTYGASGPFTIGNGGSGADLVIGNTYRVQALFVDTRASQAGRTVSIDGTSLGQYSNGVLNVTYGDSILGTGTFVADATSQDFTISIDGSTHVNAVLVHEVAVAVVPEHHPQHFSVSADSHLFYAVVSNRRKKIIL